ncbi:MAG: hypothetical protein ACRYF2_10335 [Janthinobacterium lividum]
MVHSLSNEPPNSTLLYSGVDQPEIKIIYVFVRKIRSKPTKAVLPNAISTLGRGYTV